MSIIVSALWLVYVPVRQPSSLAHELLRRPLKTPNLRPIPPGASAIFIASALGGLPVWRGGGKSHVLAVARTIEIRRWQSRTASGAAPGQGVAQSFAASGKGFQCHVESRLVQLSLLLG